MEQTKFPRHFFWGAATSAHQVEGNQRNNWSEWEQKNAARLAKEAPKRFQKLVPNWEQIAEQATSPENYISGLAADHYHKFEEDFNILKDLGLNSYRFSLEWSRLEPTKGSWDKDAVSHYKEVLGALKKRNITPWVTLWHRTFPLWVDQQGGWHNKQTIRDFCRFTERAVKEFGSEVKFWMPLNEPEFEIIGGYLGGAYPPEKKNIFLAIKAFNSLVTAHNKVYDIIHKLQPEAFVGVPHAALAVDGHKNKLLNKWLARLISYFTNWRYLNGVKNHTDFIGVQYYTRAEINVTLKPQTSNPAGFPFVEQIDKGLPKSDMGWDIDPKGLTPYLEECWKRYEKPIVITENGLPDAKDLYRAKFIEDILNELSSALEKGIDIRGYFHWSLLDNLEWDKGFWPKFGLVEVDRKTQARTVRPSAHTYAELVKKYSEQVGQ